MNRVITSFVLTVVAALGGGCISVAQSIPTRTPILVGPVDHLGGAPEPVVEDAPDETEFDKDSEMSAFVCVDTAFPTIAITRPSVAAVLDKVEEAYAYYAGKSKLKDVAPRFSHIGVGAYESFFAGCYGHNFWWGADGHVQAVK